MMIISGHVQMTRFFLVESCLVSPLLIVVAVTTAFSLHNPLDVFIHSIHISEFDFDTDDFLKSSSDHQHNYVIVYIYKQFLLSKLLNAQNDSVPVTTLLLPYWIVKIVKITSSYSTFNVNSIDK